MSLVYYEKVNHSKLFTKACRTAVSTQRVVHFFIEARMKLFFPFKEKNHVPFQINQINIDDYVEECS